MGYPTFTNPKFPIDFIVGDYYENDATPTPLGGGESVTITGSLPTGLTYDAGTNKIKGVATTVADTDISVDVYIGPTLQRSYLYTIVVLSMDITFSGGSGFNTYTTRTDTFTPSITGSYTEDSSVYNWSDPNSETGLPQGLTLNLGNLTTASFSGFAKDVGRFKAVLTVTDSVGHVFKKYFPFTVGVGTPSGTQIPDLYYIENIGIKGSSTIATFTQNYSAHNGNNPYVWYCSPSSPITGTFNVDVKTGVFNASWDYTADPPQRSNYYISVRDHTLETKVASIPGEIVQLITKHTTGTTWNITDTSGSSKTIGTGSFTFTTSSGKGWVNGEAVRIEANSYNYMEGTVTSYSGTSLIVNIVTTVGSGTYSSWNIHNYVKYVWLTTFDGATYRLYKRDAYADTQTEVASTVYPIVALATGNTQIVWADGPQTVGLDTNVFILHKVNALTLSIGTTTNYVAPVGVTINAIEQYASGVDTFAVCVNHNGGVGDKPQYYDAGANTLAAFTNVATGKNYTAYSYTSAYKIFLNQTDASFIRVTTSYTGAVSTKSVTGGLFNGTCAIDRMIPYFDNNSVVVTDSGANKIYLYQPFTTAVTTPATLASGAKPSDIVYLENKLYAILQQGLNTILLYADNGVGVWTLVDTIHLNRQYNAIALSAAPQTSVTYNMIGPVKSGTVKVYFQTTDLGKLVSSDSSGVMSAVGDAASGTVDYCTGQVTVNYPTTTEGTPYLYYENTPTKIISGNSYPVFGNTLFHNLELCSFDYQIKEVVEVRNPSSKSYDATSTTHLSVDTVNPVLHTVTLTWPTSHTPTASSVYGTIPPGLVLEWPGIDNNHFDLSGTCTTPGVYVFTVVIPGTEP